MHTDPTSRRDFLTDAARAAMAAWLGLQIPWVGALTGCARDDAPAGLPLQCLTPEEARAMTAFAARIIPSGSGAAGAVDAGAVRFVDRALGTPFFAAKVPLVRSGLADLDARARVAGGASFASLAVDRQIAMLREIEHGEFFKAARALVIIGTFADPSYGGNRGGAGWAMLGMEHRPSYVAPFGYYDARADAEFRANAA